MKTTQKARHALPELQDQVLDRAAEKLVILILEGVADQIALKDLDHEKWLEQYRSAADSPTA